MEEINLVILFIFDEQLILMSKVKEKPIEDLIESIYGVFKAKRHLYRPIETMDAYYHYNQILRSDLLTCVRTPLTPLARYKEATDSYELAMKIMYNTMHYDTEVTMSKKYLDLHHSIIQHELKLLS